ncbi:uncharacterized protein LOC108443534 [Pygocentrus nattereri]|uniref:uncharacterized protein LOC108443534 n=1 Tax=Pygocentrus nattereri TaxID=42514 RepID=UPI001891D6B3|nr:uncharacterized protein LOC108443534 [Pygocentrus nattereri]
MVVGSPGQSSKEAVRSTTAATVSIRQLSSEDAGTYQCGEAGSWSHQINLRVIRDPCCLGSKTVAGYVGETVTISCSYPEEFESHTKYFYKLDDHHIPTMMDTTETQRGRFSISEDRRFKVLSVRISDVREDDGGVYYCGVGREGESVSYHSFYTEIQLQVTDRTSTETSTQATYPGPSLPAGLYPAVGFSAALLGFALLLVICLKIKKSSLSDSVYTRPPASRTTDNEYEDDPSGNPNNISMGPVLQSIDPNTKQLGSVYQSLNPNIKQLDAVYEGLNPNTNQSDSVYQCVKHECQRPGSHLAWIRLDLRPPGFSMPSSLNFISVQLHLRSAPAAQLCNSF